MASSLINHIDNGFIYHSMLSKEDNMAKIESASVKPFVKHIPEAYPLNRLITGFDLQARNQLPVEPS